MGQYRSVAIEQTEFDEKLVASVRQTIGRDDVQLSSYHRWDRDYSRLIFDLKELWVPDYLLAKSVSITDFVANPDGGIYRIDFKFPVTISNLQDSRMQGYNSEIKIDVYCRHKDWEVGSMHIALQSSLNGPYTRGDKLTGRYSEYERVIRHGPDLEELAKFYKKQGIKPVLVARMERAVSKLRRQNPERITRCF